MLLCANPSAQFRAHQEEIESAVLRVMRGDRYILGDEVDALEKEFAEYIGTSHAIGVANGTDAIELALRALGIGLGDEVITVSHTAVATVAAIEAAGATPVLVDIDPDYYTLNPSQLIDVLTEHTKAVIAVHLYGQSADINAIQRFCQQYSLAFIEDVSQAHGATWRGRRLGSFGDIACFSCYPTKNLGAIGDAGLITTNKKELAEKVRGLRAYGWARSHYISEFPGRNSRLDELQAAVLRIKLKYLDQSNAQRQEIAQHYLSALSEIADIALPKTRIESEHVYHLFVMQTQRRDELQKYLRSNGIVAGIHYPSPVHLQPAYQERIRCHQDMGVTDTVKDRIISLPMFPELEQIEQGMVIQSIFESTRGVVHRD
jgi:dTDP-4-amino-4,6-dideoxygalactose transaminase